MTRQSDAVKMKYTPKVGDRVSIVENIDYKPTLGTIYSVENENKVYIKRDDGVTGGGRHLPGYGNLWCVTYHYFPTLRNDWDYSMKPINVSWRERITDD